MKRLWVLVVLVALGCGSTGEDGGDIGPPDIEVAGDVADGSASDALPPEDVAGEDVVSKVDVPGPPPAATRMAYDMAARPAQLPFPYDHYTVADETSPTGLRIVLDEGVRSNSVLAPAFSVFTTWSDALVTLDGFGAYAHIAAPMVGAPAVGFRQEPDSELPPTAPIQLYRWEPIVDGADTSHVLIPVPFEAEVVEGESKFGSISYHLDLIPLRPLPDKAHCVVTVSSELLDANGDPVGPDPQFEVLLGLRDMPGDATVAAALAAEQERLAPILDAVEQSWQGDWPPALVFDFTVSSERAPIMTIGQSFQEDPTLRAVEYTFDVDGDEQPDIWRPGDPGFPGLGTPGHVGLFARGQFQRRDYRDPDYFKGAIVLDEDGAPILHHLEPVDFYLALPSESAGGGWPVLMLGHGINADKEQMKRLIGDYAALGIAAFSFDFPEHGNDGGGGLAFIPAGDALAIRDNFRQAGIDIMTARYLIQRWVDEGLDLDEDGETDLDTTRMAYLGHSFGAMHALTGLALVDEPGAVVLNVGGGGIIHFLGGYLSQIGLDKILPTEALFSMKALAGHVLCGGDPLLYGDLLRPRSAPWVEGTRHVLATQAELDDTMPADVMKATAVTLDLPFLGPVVDPAPNVTPGESGSESGFTQWAGEEHVFALGGDNPDTVAAVRAQYVHFVSGYIFDGLPEVIHPWVTDEAR